MTEKGKCRPSKGNGERWLDCKVYEDCLSLAAIRNWRTFNCESCDLYQAVFGKRENEMSERAKKSENVRLCKECGLRPTIQASSPYCSICLGLKAKKARARRKEAIEETSRGTKDKQGDRAALKTEEAPTKTIGKGEIVDPGRNMSLIFQGKHSYLLEEIERLAEEEIRTIDEQIIYIIKNYLASTQGPGGH